MVCSYDYFCVCETQENNKKKTYKSHIDRFEKSIKNLQNSQNIHIFTDILQKTVYFSNYIIAK